MIPDVCFVEDVCRELRLSRRTFHRLRALKLLPLTELQRLDRRLRFAGESVAALKEPKWATRRYARSA